MAKNRNRDLSNGSILFGTEQDTGKTPATSLGDQKEKGFMSGFGRGERFAIIGVCLLLVVGALGAGFGEKIFSTLIPNNQSRKTNQSSQNSSTLSSLNPFASLPLPTPAPQLSKEYIYAGSRMLAVEDANASALPPADLGVWRPSNGT